MEIFNEFTIFISYSFTFIFTSLVESTKFKQIAGKLFILIGIRLDFNRNNCFQHIDFICHSNI